MSGVDWTKADDVKQVVVKLVKTIPLNYVDINRVHCYRSYGSRARAYARIWGFSRIWQLATGQRPQYILEVLGEKYDNLDEKHKLSVLVHELSHIPVNFSGALIPHLRRGKRNFHKKIDLLMGKYLTNSGGKI